jgi:hypothetical protein
MNPDSGFHPCVTVSPPSWPCSQGNAMPFRRPAESDDERDGRPVVHRVVSGIQSRNRQTRSYRTSSGIFLDRQLSRQSGRFLHLRKPSRQRRHIPACSNTRWLVSEPSRALQPSGASRPSMSRVATSTLCPRPLLAGACAGFYTAAPEHGVSAQTAARARRQGRGPRG